MVFGHEIDSVFNPELLTAPPEFPAQPKLTYDALFIAAQNCLQAKGDANLYISGISAPFYPDSNVLVWYKSRNKAEDTLHEMYIHPYSGKKLGERVFGAYFGSFIYTLHYSLFLGDTGRRLLGYVGISIILLLFSGVFLWWTRRGRHHYSHNRNRPSLPWHRNIHRLTGIYFVPLLLVIVTTGIYMELQQPVRQLFRQWVPLSQTPETTIIAQGNAHRMSIDNAIAIAEAEFPESAFSRIYFSANDNASWLLTFTPRSDPKKHNGYDRISIDSYTGKIMTKRNWVNASGGDRVLEWMFPLHNGEAFNLPGRILIFWSGLIPLVLFITGILCWIRRSRTRKAL